jgi:response regulator RpfG family c-di-GMP phosphodiesterase
VKEVVPDLIITDIKMPHRDGYELCRAIKELRDYQHIPVVIVSALGGELDVDRGFNAGANEYVTKPVDLHDLGQRIQSIFRGIALRGRERVLVAVWSQIERSALDFALCQQGFEVQSVRDAEEAFEAAKRAPPGVLVADFDLSPDGSGLDVISLRKRLREDRATRDLPLVVLLGRNQKVDQAKRDKLDGASFVAKPYSAERLVSLIERILGERRLKLEVERDFLLQAINVIVTTLESRDKYTRGHSENVAKYSMMIGKHVYESAEELGRLHLSARLHDIGKIGVPDAILLKPGKLTDEEMAKMQTHPMEGVRILSPIPSLQDIIPGVRWHHERLDGKGYPDRLKGTEIPLQARIISVGDTFDALTSHRPYRAGCPVEKAFAILRSAAGDQLDPALVDIFIREFKEQRAEIPAQAV